MWWKYLSSDIKRKSFGSTWLVHNLTCLFNLWLVYQCNIQWMEIHFAIISFSAASLCVWLFLPSKQTKPIFDKKYCSLSLLYCLLAVTNCGLEGVDLWKPCQIYPILPLKNRFFVNFMSMPKFDKKYCSLSLLFCLPIMTYCGPEGWKGCPLKKYPDFF